MNGASGETLSSIGYCPRCGYDQRGLPQGSNCPECGLNVLVGLASKDINRWVEHMLLMNGSVAILQGVGLACGAISLTVYPRNPTAAVMLGTAALAYLIAGTLWYLGIVGSFAWQRWSPRFKNVSQPRHARLLRWMLCNGVLVALPVAFVWLRWT